MVEIREKEIIKRGIFGIKLKKIKKYYFFNDQNTSFDSVLEYYPSIDEPEFAILKDGDYELLYRFRDKQEVIEYEHSQINNSLRIRMINLAYAALIKNVDEENISQYKVVSKFPVKGYILNILNLSNLFFYSLNKLNIDSKDITPIYVYYLDDKKDIAMFSLENKSTLYIYDSHFREQYIESKFDSKIEEIFLERLDERFIEITVILNNYEKLVNVYDMKEKRIIFEEWLTEERYMQIEIRIFNNKVYVLNSYGYTYILEDEKREKIFAGTNYDIVRFHEKLPLIFLSKKGKNGIRKLNGEVVFDTIYNEIFETPNRFIAEEVENNNELKIVLKSEII